MKLAASLVALAVASTVAGEPLWGLSQGNDQIIFDEDLPVPGSNPLTYCSKPDKWKLEIKSADIDPNPPAAGKSLAITASGTLEEDIEEGAKVHVEVSYGFIKLINQELDLCEYAGQVDLECPLKKGDLKLSKTVDLPNEIPPGKYNVVADVYTKDKETITCLKASVVFSRG